MLPLETTPLSSAPPPIVAEKDIPAPILVVDDNLDNLRLLQAVLKPLNQRILEATDGEEAVAMARSTRFAVILLDVQMPGIDGFETAERIREIDGEEITPIVFISATYKDQVNVKRGYSLGAIDYMFKPIALDVVRAKVAAFIELFQRKEALRQALSRARWAEQQLERKAAELARSNEELEQFAYVASHDLKEPLRMVSSYMQLLSRRYRGRLDQNADDFINYATEGAERMRVLIDDLLTYSRVGTRGKPFGATDMKVVFEHVHRSLEVAAAECGATLECAELPAVHGDERQLEQLLQNLIANAIKFRGDRTPHVHVRAQLASQLLPPEQRELGDRSWVFSVRDNGIGIDPQFFGKIFLIFQRLHQREQYPGTGIGLAVCKKIVERHGGRIWVESQPGQGTTFYFTLPAADAITEQTNEERAC